ncbi:MAG: NAD(P)H-quinone oxidoreductase [Candidatus Nanopelagicales bacterium]|nr:NAD(P)H-quinone oxidoreductase [Candidatus Nanopelagicales bacterium]
MEFVKAIVVTAEEMTLAEVADSLPGPGEVLVEVAAAGVNRADLLQRQGFYPPPPGVSDILGLEVSGYLDGQPVCALLAGGGYAQKVAVPRGQVMPLPPGLDVVTAAAIPEVACTVYSNLAMTAHLQPGEWVLIHGGGSGIGTFAIQWARAIGARVAVTAGSDEKLARCAELGAEVLINYREQDFVEALPRPVDVILDVVGAKYLERNVSALADGGRLVVIGLQGGVKAELNLGSLLSRRGCVIATSLRTRSDVQKAQICSAVVRDVWPLYDAGAIKPVVDRVLPLAQAEAAHRLLADSGHFGKVLLEV